MTTRKETRKLTKNSKGSVYILLPKEFIKSLGWRENAKNFLLSE